MDIIERSSLPDLIKPVLVTGERLEWVDRFKFKSDREQRTTLIVCVVLLAAIPAVVFLAPNLVQLSSSNISMMTFTATLCLGLLFLSTTRENTCLIAVTDRRLIVKSARTPGFQFSFASSDLDGADMAGSGEGKVVRLLLRKGNKQCGYLGAIKLNDIADPGEALVRLQAFCGKIQRAEENMDVFAPPPAPSGKARSLVNLVIGLVVLVLSGNMYHTYLEKANWPVEMAKVKSVKIEKEKTPNAMLHGDFSDKYSVERELELTHDGTSYSINQKGSESPIFDTMDKAVTASKIQEVPVHFNTEKPEDGCADPAAAARGILVIIYMCGVLVVSEVEARLLRLDRSMKGSLKGSALVLLNIVLAVALYRFLH
ncbi:MAG: hypothetical protein KC777_01985 [Cyanobacteria bacterium HKST-UBA02]|nr:hypothetical protein [Cyanobacteria bacterium HKST-UBA02]